MLAPILGTLHNLWHYQWLMSGMRAAIEAGDPVTRPSERRPGSRRRIRS